MTSYEIHTLVNVVFDCRSWFRSGIIMQFVQRELPTSLGLISSRTKDTFLEHLWRGCRWSHAQWDDNTERSFRHDDYRLTPNDYCKLSLDIQSCIHPNWHEGGHFPSIFLFGSDFVSWILIIKFQTLLEVKIDINQVNMTPCQPHWVL